jgi:DNA polymerase-3 subunit gamma/tau
MPNLALYRKYRSKTFEELIGQPHVVTALKASLATGRISHAYLFVGPRGTGKTSTARILAKALNCIRGPAPEPCNECEICQAIDSGHGDVLEMDAASESGVDQVREHIVQAAKYVPMRGRYRVFVIDEVHDLSQKAFDALLKTLEEPPAHVVFILATTELNKVPVTIRSRCQRYEFRRGALSDLFALLKRVCEAENIQAEDSALAMIARMADGGYRDALTILEQVAVASDNQVTVDSVVQQLGLVAQNQVDELFESAIAGDGGRLIGLCDEILRMGKDPSEVIESLLLRLSELTYVFYDLDTLKGVDPERQAADHALAQRIGKERLFRFREILVNALKEIREVSLPRLWLEVNLLRLVETDSSPASPRQGLQELRGEPSRASKENPAPAIPSSEASSLPPTSLPEVAQPQKKEGRDWQAVWKEAVGKLQKRFRAAGKMLEGTEVVDVQGNAVVVRFDSQFQYERMSKRPDLQKYVWEAFAETTGENSWVIRYVAPADGDPPPKPPSPPLKGEELARAVEEVFEVNP